MMTSRQRLLAALDGRLPDRLPVTTHHVMTSFLDTYQGGGSSRDFFDRFGLDAIAWTVPYLPREGAEAAEGAVQPDGSVLDPGALSTPEWRLEADVIAEVPYRTTRYRIATPGGTLTTVIQENQYTSWVAERLLKRPADVDLVGAYAPAPRCDAAAVARTAAAMGERGIVRGHVCGFDLFGQPGTWQDAACLFGIEALILATYDDPAWVHTLLDVLLRRKRTYVDSLAGAPYDLVELGGGDASTTVISPRIFDRFVAPYDAELIARAHAAGQRIVYHTCGGMMPILERIADMGADAMETFTPPDMGGDVDLAEAKRRIGRRVCMIGGFDQFHGFVGCTPEATRAMVRHCFEAAGAGGGYILSPSDHFFDAEPALLEAFADEARQCRYVPAAEAEPAAP